MNGVLNETTNTVHKHDRSESDLKAKCGATSQVKREQLRMARVPEAVTESDASKCGRCFEEGGGY